MKRVLYILNFLSLCYKLVFVPCGQLPKSQGLTLSMPKKSLVQDKTQLNGQKKNNNFPFF